MPIHKLNQDYINRLEKRVNKLRDRLYSYSYSYDEGVYRHDTTRRRISKEKHHELKTQYHRANNKYWEIAKKERYKITKTVLDYGIAFLVMDKRQNPSLYPDWLSFKFPDSKETTSILSIQPYIDLEKAIKTDDYWNSVVANASNRLENFFKRYFPSDADIRIEPYLINGIENYIKKVFRKEIKKRIKEIDTRDCIHSMVFRVRGRYRTEVQIHPRWRDKYPCYGWEKQKAIEKEMKDILKEYGWMEGRNYTQSKQRD